MAATTEIAWCDATFNCWIGCTKVSEGCRSCYAEAYAKRYGKAAWGPSGTRVKTSAAYWKQPVKWNREAGEAGIRKRVFCASLADVFEDWSGPILDSKGRTLCAFDGAGELLPLENGPDAATPRHQAITMDRIRRDLFALIDATPNLDWLLLTKRPENIRRMWPSYETDELNGKRDFRPGRLGGLRMDNVWLLTSIATQADADKNIPELLKCRDLVPVLGVSAEPLIERVNLEVPWEGETTLPTIQVDWVIVGGESGPGARPMHPDWARSIRDQCDAAEVPFFFKQWGEWQQVGTRGEFCFNPGASIHDLVTMDRVGKKSAGRLLDGREHNEFPTPKLTTA